MRASTARVLGALVLSLACQTAVRGQLSGLYGWDRATGDLYVISPTTTAATLIGSSGLTGLQSLELAADGFLYGVWTDSGAQNATLYRINPATAAPAIVGLLGIAGTVFEGGLAVGPTGTAYATNQGTAGSPHLFQVSLTTDAATLIGHISGGSHDINGLAWRDDGVLIGLDR
jgi:DNA-binding beta-propeller fold protein YncE